MCKVFPDAPFSASYCDRGDGKRSYSLRSLGDFDVSAVARMFGGGGHRNAAGFVVDLPADSSGAMMIARERQRHHEEGWTHDHDDQYQDGVLALVAALYATPTPLYSLSIDDQRHIGPMNRRGLTLNVDDPWPTEWPSKYDKRDKHPRLKQLATAGSLIAAEIDRLLRAGARGDAE